MADSQQIWSEYYARARRRRLAEASLVLTQVRAAVPSTAPLVLRFVHRGKVKADVDRLANQLSEYYAMSVVADPDGSHWLARGATDSSGLGVELADQELIDWVSFMIEVAQSYACVFSTWSLTDPISGRSWSNRDVEESGGRENPCV